jgi:hypothetical protein
MITAPLSRTALLGTALLGAALLLPACGQTHVEPSYSRLGERIELRVGETTRVGLDGLQLTFRGVSADSRCPSDVQCVWAGDATVNLAARGGGGDWTPLVLHTGVEPRSADYGEWVIELEALEPQPRGARTPRPGEYRVTVRVDLR